MAGIFESVPAMGGVLDIKASRRPDRLSEAGAASVGLGTGVETPATDGRGIIGLGTPGEAPGMGEEEAPGAYGFDIPNEGVPDPLLGPKENRVGGLAAGVAGGAGAVPAGGGVGGADTGASPGFLM